MDTPELPSMVHEAIQHLCADGDALAAAGRYQEAIAEYNRAWEVVPEPKDRWNASTWILAAIADAAFLAGYNTSAREALEYAMISRMRQATPSFIFVSAKCSSTRVSMIALPTS